MSRRSVRWRKILEQTRGWTTKTMPNGGKVNLRTGPADVERVLPGLAQSDGRTQRWDPDNEQRIAGIVSLKVGTKPMRAEKEARVREIAEKIK